MDDTAQDGVLQTGGPPDPMQAVQAALAYGRQKMGLPAKFYSEPGGGTGGMPSFDDGGLVDDMGADQGVIPQGGGQGPPDPRATLHYLTGAGAVSGEVASALEMQADPDGQMDPAERTLRTLSAVSDDKTRFGLLQHYRSKFNAYAAGAKVALAGSQTRPADMGQAAQAATQAFAHLPTGRSIQFAPTAKGIAVLSKSLGGQTQPAQQAYDDGGEVEDEGGVVEEGGDSAPAEEQGAGDRLPPAEGEDKDRLVSMGGEAVARKDNVEDRRDQHGEGVIWKNDRKVAPTPDEGGREFIRGPDKSDDEGVIRKQKGRAGMLGMQKSFDDGGEVDDEEGDGSVTAAVTEGSGEGENVPDEVPPEQSKFRTMLGDAIGMRGRQTQVDTQTKGAEGWLAHSGEEDAEPVVLSPDQFKKLLDGGYDQPLESGWDKFIGGIMSALGPSEASAADAGTGADTNGAQWTPVKAVKDKLKGLFGGGDDTAAALAADPDTAPQGPQMSAQTPQEPQIPLPPQRPNNQTVMPKTSQPAPVPTPQPKPAQQMAKDKDNELMERLNNQANKLFPWISQGAQRSHYIAHMMEKQGEHENKIEVADKTWGARGAIAANTEAGRDRRAEGSRQGKMDVARLAAQTKMTTAAAHELASTLRTNILASSDMASSVQKQLEYLTPYAQRFGVDPRDLYDTIQSLGQSAPGGGAAPQGARPQSQVGNPKAAKAGDKEPYTVKGVTKMYTFGTDGLWHKPKEGQGQ